MSGPIAHTTYGDLQGDYAADGRVMRFRGVPYAKPPVGALRWRPPQRLEPWSGVRPALEPSAACIQPPSPPHSLVHGGEGPMSEDCLYLNVWTGGLGAAERRPVIVWIHLGGFMMGWGQARLYDGAALARAGAVVVTINYRLGRLGFLAHPALSAESPHGVSGNYGLMDQVAALEWVAETIAAFGGDPGRVTLYGVSAGASSISALTAAPAAKGLFHRAIAGSGGLLGPVGDSCEGGEGLQTLDAAQALGASVMDRTGARTADELRALSAEAVLTAKIPIFWEAPRGLLDTTYPILDGWVLPLDPTTAIVQGRHNDVPLITGAVAHESSITPFNGDTESYLADSAALLGDDFERFLELYPAGPEGLTGRSSRVASSDRLFSWQNWSWARLQARHGRSPVWYYTFDHAPPVPPGSAAEQEVVGEVGAFHSADLPYAFRNLDARPWPWRDEDRALSDTLSGYWLAFASTGDPNGGDRPYWGRFDEASRETMRFAGGAVAVRAPEVERFAFWDDVFGRHRVAFGDRTRVLA